VGVLPFFDQVGVSFATSEILVPVLDLIFLLVRQPVESDEPIALVPELLEPQKQKVVVNGRELPPVVLAWERSSELYVILFLAPAVGRKTEPRWFRLDPLGVALRTGKGLWGRLEGRKHRQ
jgi:hypothetical protein